MGEGYQPKAGGTGLMPPPRYPNGINPGQQIQVDLTNATQRKCDCGCQYFTPVVQVFTVSALVSPIGKELTAQQPVLICLECKEVLK